MNCCLFFVNFVLCGFTDLWWIAIVEVSIDFYWHGCFLWQQHIQFLIQSTDPSCIRPWPAPAVRIGPAMISFQVRSDSPIDQHDPHSRQWIFAPS